MPWRESSVADQRLEFVRLAQQGTISFAELCRRYGVKRDTGYKWLARFRRDGFAGLADRSRQPHSSPNRRSAKSRITYRTHHFDFPVSRSVRVGRRRLWRQLAMLRASRQAGESPCLSRQQPSWRLPVFVGR